MLTITSTQITNLVDELKTTGDYESADELLLDALNRLKIQLAEQSLANLLEVGLQQVRRGESILHDPSDFESRIANAKVRLARGDTPISDVSR